LIESIEVPFSQRQPTAVNRLASEPSPYLRQHATNPVDWWPWCDEAFAEAQRRDVPVLLSIGYSTCHWCHVMEHESFSSAEIAARVNDRMVCVKVDREERPEVDEIYMAACQVFTQLTEGRASGGWPLTAFLEPTGRRPFFVGTYFPPQPAHGRPAFVQVVDALAEAWRSRRGEVLEQTERLASATASHLAHLPPSREIGRGTLDAAVDALMRIHDEDDGGFGGAPRFPQPALLRLLIDAAWKRDPVRRAVGRTLDAMATGGLFDQIAGGFHRYCVDSSWTVPHFEKMLYDNAQLIPLYAIAAQRSGDEYHAEVARRAVDWALREMRGRRVDGASGSSCAFLAAQDADTEGREGATFVWRRDEVESALHDADAGDLIAFAHALYGFDGPANFRDPHHPDEPPAWVPRLGGRPEAIATTMKIDLELLRTQRARLDSILLERRSKRPQPMVDDKVIASWNGMMITGLADGGAALGESSWLDAAADAARFIIDHLRAPDGSLRRIWHRGSGGVDGGARIAAPLEDHGAVARGLTALGRATADRSWFHEAASIVDQAIKRFGDGDGGLFETDADRTDLFVRARSHADGAMPAGGSMLLHAMLDLDEAGHPGEWRRHAERLVHRISGVLVEQPLGTSVVLRAVARMRGDAV